MNQSSLTQAKTSDVIPDRPLVFVGLMGAGKTCIGRKIAERFNLPFTDADSEIEAAAGLSVADIFATYGEPEFRDGERRVIRRLLSSEPMVLSTGGGAFMDPDTRQLILQKALSVWLRADIDLLIKRTAGRTHRPILNKGEPREILSGLIDRRYPVYAEADITVDCHDESPDDMTDRVASAIAGHLRHNLSEESRAHV
ncbi:MAG: shikimate kinase [Rhodospirillales bacterium]